MGRGRGDVGTLMFIAEVEETCKFDFEAGIYDWEKTGSAFNNQPTYGDNPTARNRGQHANQQGRWWIGGAEDRPSISVTAGKMQGDAPKGTLTSPYFRIIGGHISFLIGGGCDIKTVRAELIIGNKVVRHATGECNETMKRKAWNVHGYVGRRARVKLVDFSSAGWGHINFDDLKGDISCS
ncbi:putative glycosyl hydrolase ecdE [Acropora cervicornis]|uniref:Glycosyl hydrolase ecdE n=1 Tax=Acropora cervicornis TaxID=6130 RepID=A0AAD9UR19_ACRCE|nr:putative glycosyl hydrolase ecdE [Acropora cervicornis]